MPLSTVSLLVLCMMLALGLLPGIVAQMEILSPGLQVFTADEGLYNAATTIHGAALSQGLPLAAIALSLGIATERMRLPMLRILATVALAASPLAFFVMAWAGLSHTWDLYESMRTSLSISVGVLFIANVTLAFVQPGARVALIVLTGLSLLALGFGVFGTVVVSVTEDSVLHDTYALVAADHAVGVSAVLGAIAGATAYVMHTRSVRTLAASLAGGVAISVIGYLVMSLTLRAGFMGMPRRYVDYAEAFANVLQAASVWTLALAMAVIIAFGWILSNLRHKPPPGPEAAFD